MTRIQLFKSQLIFRSVAFTCLGVMYLSPMPANAQTGAKIEWNPVYADKPTDSAKRTNAFHLNLCGGIVENPVSVTFSNDSKRVCIGNANANIKTTPGGLFGQLSIPDSIAEGSLASCAIWDLKSGEQRRRIPGHHAWKITAAAFSPDGSMLATTAYQYSYAQQKHFSSFVSMGPEYKVKVWDTLTGEELHSWDKVGGGLAFSSDSDSLVCTSSHSGVQVFDVREGSPPKTWNLRCSDDVPPITLVSSDEMLLFIEFGNAFGRGRHTPTRFNIKTGQEVERFLSSKAGDDNHNNYEIFSAACSVNSSKLATSTENSIIIWDLTTGTETRRIDATVSSQALSIDNRGFRVLSIDKNGMLKEFELETGELLRQTELPPGKYHVSPDEKAMAFLPDEDQGFWEIVDLQSRSPIARFHQSTEHNKWAVETVDGSEIHSPSTDIKEETLQEHADGVRLCLSSLHENGIPQNVLIEEMDNGGEVTTNPHLGKLFVLSIGISKYKFPEYQLGFAKKDAEDISSCFRSQKGKLYSEVFVECTTDENATRANIEKGLEWLSRSCTEEDVAIVFLSGHGITARKGLYFLPWEGDVESISNTCVNWQSIAEQLLQCKARQIVCFLDCCHAGAFSKVRFATQDEISSALSGNDRVSIFCSSDGAEKSLEDDAWKNGAFSKALIQGMSHASDENKDGRISLTELFEYTEAAVASLTHDRQHPRLAKKHVTNDGTFIGSVAIAKAVREKDMQVATAERIEAQRKLASVTAGTQIWDGTLVLGIVDEDIRFEVLKQERGWAAGRFEINGEFVVGWVKLTDLTPVAP